jgi:signal transduction histidine kinase/HD-like signal output (HDOD) protein
MTQGSSQPVDKERVELILERIDQLPTLSTIAQKLLDTASNDDVDISELAALIESDPSLTGKVLSLCRRSDRGLGDSITSVMHAITLVGLEAIRAAVLSVEVYELLNNDEDDQKKSAFDSKGHWQGCMSVASACELIAAEHKQSKVRPEAAFTAGLLHGLGRSALNMALPESYGKVLRVAEQRGEDSASLERELIGIDHHAAGRRLAEHWGLPQSLQDIAWLYDLPAESIPATDHRSLIGIVATARALCRRLNMGWFGDFGQPRDLAALAPKFGLDADKIEEISTKIHERLSDRCSAFGMEEISPAEILIQSVTRANARLAAMNRALSARSDHGSQQKKVLDAIGSFCLESHQGNGFANAMSHIATSAADLIDGELFTIVTQADRDQHWRLFRFTPDGQLIRSEILEPPMISMNDRATVSMLADPHQSVSATGKVIPWISQYAAETVDLGDIRVLPLLTGDESIERNGQAAILLVESEFERSVKSATQRKALLSVWGAAVASALRHEHGRRLSDELADRHRDLSSTQAKLAETQSMARLGVMTAGAAHEMNNPLTVIKGYAQVLRTKVVDSELRKLAEKVGHSAQEISDLISSMNLIADPPEPEPEKISIQGLINNCVMEARERTRMNCASRVSVPSHLPVAMLDPQLLSQALIELISNAAESNSDEIIEIRVQIDQLDDRLLIMVKDHGCGMSQKTVDHAFDPFFSEKPAGRQTGLGLCRARRVIEIMGGTIAISSKETIGTRVLVTLPTWRVTEKDRDTSKAA